MQALQINIQSAALGRHQVRAEQMDAGQFAAISLSLLRLLHEQRLSNMLLQVTPADRIQLSPSASAVGSTQDSAGPQHIRLCNLQRQMMCF